MRDMCDLITFSVSRMLDLHKKTHYFLSPLWCDVGHMYDMHDFWSIIFIGLHRSRDSVFPVCQISPLPLSLNQSKGDW